MTDTAINTNVVCIACGADVRRDADFCYGCGGKLRPQMKSDDAAPIEAGQAELQDDAPQEPVREAPPTPTVETLNGKSAQSALTPAMVRRRRIAARKPVEIEWHPAEMRTPVFFIVSVVAAAIAALILAAAMYLK